MEHYCVPDYSGTAEFLSHLAKKMGKLRKGGPARSLLPTQLVTLPTCSFTFTIADPPGGVPDTEAVARTVIRDWNTSVAMVTGDDVAKTVVAAVFC